ncbi:MAG: hypothetical protein EPN86_04010 [Nanoarchaeota archaeon]|nr:MAG: hypothetical protein EPN86_04010 [Nanoarchaeota archaeon]
MSTVSLEEYVDNLNHVRHRYAIYEHQFRDRKKLEDDEIDSLTGIVRSLEAARYGLPPAKDRRRAKSTLKPLEAVVEGIRNETEQIIVSINNSFSNWLENQGKLLEEKSEDDGIWNETLRGIDSYRRFSDSVLSAIGLKPRSKKTAAKLEEVALKKAELDGRLSLISAQYPVMNFASADSVEPVIRELDGIRKGYESVGFRRKLFPIPRRVEVYSFATRYAQIGGLAADAQYIKDNFSFVASSRAGLERDTQRMKRIKSKALALPDERVDPSTYDSLGSLLYTKNLVGEYRDLSYTINDLIAHDRIMELKSSNGRRAAKPAKNLDDVVATIAVAERYAPVVEQASIVVEQYASPRIKVATDEPAIQEKPAYEKSSSGFTPSFRFNFMAYLQFSRPPSEVTWKVGQILSGRTEAKQWDDRLRKVDETLRNAQTPDREEIEYIGGIREGLQESLRSGPLRNLCGVLVGARTPIRMAMDTIDSYIGQKPQNISNFTTA